MRMPLLTVGGLWAASVLGFLYACDLSPHEAEVQASSATPVRHSAEEEFGREAQLDEEDGEQTIEELLQDVEARAQDIARALELSYDDHALLLGILLHEADRLDAARGQASNPLMAEALGDHRLAVAEWKAREIRRSFGPVVAERIASYESEEAGRITITPAHATSRR